jgi:hypothetical protein
VVGAPGECGAAEEAVEETGVEGFEDLVEIIVVAGGCGDAFASAGLTDVLGLLADGLGGDVAAVAVGVDASDGLLVELREKDVSNGVVDCFRGGLEDIGEADVKTAFTKADCGVEGGEAAEADLERRDGRAGTEFAVLVFEDGDEGSGCGDFFGARLFGSGWMKRWRGMVGKERGGRCWGRRKELQELAQSGGAGMLRCGQVVVLVTASMALLDQTPFSNCFQFLFLELRCNRWFAAGCVAASSRGNGLAWDFSRRDVVGFFGGWVGGEPGLLAFDKVSGFFTDVADRFEGEFAGEVVGLVFGRLLQVGRPALGGVDEFG